MGSGGTNEDLVLGRFKDLTGMRFGKLVVLHQAEDKFDKNGNKIIMWHCKCDCGNEKDVRSNYLTCKFTRSCGCLAKEIQKKNLNQKKYNQYDLSGEYGIGYTSNGEEFWFDLEDYDLIKDYCWYFKKKKDKNTYLAAKDENHKEILLHKLLFPEAEQVDHIKHNEFDNRKSQLRLANNMLNCYNQGLQSNNKSGVTGVCWHSRDQIWEARITVNKEQIHLGYFDKFEEAVKVRKEAEEKYFGEWSYDNSMKQIESN